MFKSGNLQPSFKGNLEVHNGQEWVYSVLLLDNGIEYLIISLLISLVLNFECHQVNAVLRPQFENLHLLIDLHISVLPPHAPIEHLIKKDVAIVTFNSHLKQLFLQLSVIVLPHLEAKSLAFVS